MKTKIEKARDTVSSMTPQDLASIGVTGRAQREFLETLDDCNPGMRIVRDLAARKTVYL